MSWRTMATCMTCVVRCRPWSKRCARRDVVVATCFPGGTGEGQCFAVWTSGSGWDRVTVRIPFMRYPGGDRDWGKMAKVFFATYV
jgi:hypothetical protein